MAHPYTTAGSFNIPCERGKRYDGGSKNDMMKRFLSLKNVKLGGAQITSDPSEADNIVDKLKNILLRATSDGPSTPLIKNTTALYKNEKGANEVKNLEKYASVDISHILKKLPLNESFLKTLHQIIFSV